MSISASKRDAYARLIESLSVEAYDLGTEAAERAGEYVVAVLEEVQQQIARYSPEQWSNGAYRRLEADIRRAIDAMGVDLVDHALDSLDRSAELAGDGMLRAIAGARVLPASALDAWPAVDAKLVNVASGFTTDLLVNVSQGLKDDVAGWVRRQVTSARPQIEVVSDVAAALEREGADVFHFGTWFSRAVTDVQTETARLYGAVQYSRGLQLESVYPGSRKSWWYRGIRTRAEHEHVGRETQRAPIPIRDPFVLRVSGGGTVRLWYPVDSAAEGSDRDVKRMTINCGCRKVDHLPLTSADPRPLDTRAADAVAEAADYVELARRAA